MSRFHFCLLALLASSPLLAAELSGIISNFRTGEPLSGATVTVLKSGQSESTNARGEYALRGLQPGRFVVEATAADFSAYRWELEIIDAGQSLHRNIELHSAADVEPAGEAPRYLLGEVTVLSTRASADYPVTYSNLSRAEIEQQNYAQDLPLLLSELPNLNAYSDGANGTGYSYLRMRGFSQNRVAVQLNGIPLNDAGSHEVFWIDLPDFAEDLQDVQVQRGVGSSLYGPAAFGGTINLVTRTPGIEDRPGLRAESSYGTWNTRRAMMQYTSGRVNDRYGFAGRLTRMESDGYRNGAWSKMWSYYLCAARFTTQHTSRVVFYGGPEQTHLAYEGIPDSLLHSDRRANPLPAFDLDNFFQPHYELHDEWKASDRVTLNSTLYLFRGDGYYDQWKQDADAEQYFFDERDQSTLNLLRRRNVGETDWGFIPRATIDHAHGQIMLGAEARLHQARHDGTVLWSSDFYGHDSPNYHYYDYRVRKRAFSAYAHELYRLTDRLRAMLDLQWQGQRYLMDQDRLWNATVDRKFSALSPRAGLNYLLVEPNSKANRPAISLYGSLSRAQREPAFNDIYDPQDFYSIPYSAPQRFRSNGVEQLYVGPALRPEKLMNLETGVHAQWYQARVGANLYWMRLRDEIIPYSGQLDDNGVPVSGNAERTLHQGIELIAAVSPLRALTLSGNLALTDHRYQSYREFDWNTYTMASRNGNRLPADPAYLANLRAEYRFHGARAAIGWRTVAKQYIDNTQTDATTVPAYSLLNLDLGYRVVTTVAGLRGIDASLRVNNLLDTEYESFGYADWNDGSPRYIVGAPRALYATLGIDL
ncbi:TonB-dependent receptor [candidate division KSB1 bacterium]|nr:TonB-dependent receptor [candidate division KSB1 bacterium]